MRPLRNLSREQRYVDRMFLVAIVLAWIGLVGGIGVCALAQYRLSVLATHLNEFRRLPPVSTPSDINEAKAAVDDQQERNDWLRSHINARSSGQWMRGFHAGLAGVAAVALWLLYLARHLTRIGIGAADDLRALAHDQSGPASPRTATQSPAVARIAAAPVAIEPTPVQRSQPTPAPPPTGTAAAVMAARIQAEEDARAAAFRAKRPSP